MEEDTPQDEQPESPQEEIPPPTDHAPAPTDIHDFDQTWGDFTLTGPLKPRHKKLAELHAQGKSNNEIAKELGYHFSRVSILLGNRLIREEVSRIRERIYQDTLAKRLKDQADSAMNVIEECLTDRTNRWKENLKLDAAKWVVEKLDGKAIQKIGIEENTLAAMLDKLDNLKNSGKMLDVTPEQVQIPENIPPGEEIIELPARTEEESEEDRLKEWVSDLAAPRVTKK